MSQLPGDPLKHIYNVCDPFVPATSANYHDCRIARGSSAFVDDFVRHLSLANDYVCFLFTGHIGSGKSSELEKLRRELATSRIGNRNHFPIFLDADTYLDKFDTDVTDVLLAAVTELAATLAEHPKVEIQDSYFLNLFKGLWTVLTTEVEFKEAEASFLGLKAKIQGLRKNPTAREKVRQALRPQTTRLLDEMNSLFDKSRKELHRHTKRHRGSTYDDMVLIIDNLEKISRVGERAEGKESHHELFIERAPQLTSLDIHVVYTVPLRLAREFGPQLGLRYDKEPFVLPMIKTKERGSAELFSTGVECLSEILAKRVAPLSLAEVFNDDALRFLIEYCGGNVRHLLMFVQNACTYAANIPIPLDAVHLAIQQTVRTYSAAISSTHWDKLARLDASPNQEIRNRDEDYLEMLENISVLEYIDGAGPDPFESSEPWYGVHPIVRELRKFKESKAKLLTDKEKE